ncbi:MAG TPA: hypothetical protein VF546_03340 [Pyrinomonadaceae bacterium]|jgi:hypothetical protein
MNATPTEQPARTAAEAEPANPVSFQEVLAAEWQEIKERRAKYLYRPRQAADADAQHDIVGLALSGGGIRSATFCLGVLQELHRLNLLRIFDYLSTVSGGGYVGGWWSAWLSRAQINPQEAPTGADGDDAARLGPEDIKHPHSLIVKLLTGDDPTSAALRAHFRPATLAGLKAADPHEPVSPELLGALAEELNLAIAAGLFTRLRDEARPAPAADQPAGRAAGASRAAGHSRWANRLLLEEQYPYELRDVFPPREQIEPERFAAPAAAARPDAASTPEAAQAAARRGAESARSAWRDPIHHLRLYANYLTPRKGLLSADTWRAISVTTRNLALTWLALLPMLVVPILVAKLYFFFMPDHDVHDLLYNSACPDAFRHRLAWIGYPAASLFALLVAVCAAWLLSLNERATPAHRWLQRLSFGAVCVFVYTLAGMHVPLPKGGAGWWVWATAAAAVALLLFLRFWPFAVGEVPGDDAELKRQWRSEVRRNKISWLHTRLLIALAATVTILLLAGFGHEPLDYLLRPRADKGGLTLDSLLSLGSLLTVLGSLFPILAAAGSVFTAVRAAPAADEGQARTGAPSFVSRVIFASTPLLVLVVLAGVVSWLSHALLRYLLNPEGLYFRPEAAVLVQLSIVTGVVLCFGFALYEMQWAKQRRPAWSRLGLALLMTPMFIFCLYWPQTFTQVVTFPTVFGYETADLALTALWLAVAVLGWVVLWRADSTSRASGYTAAGLSPRLLFGAVLALLGGVLVFARLLAVERYKQPLGFVLPAAATAVTGSLILYRLLTMRAADGEQFELRVLRNTPLGRSGQPLLLLQFACLVLPFAGGCWLHALTKHGWAREADSAAPAAAQAAAAELIARGAAHEADPFHLIILFAVPLLIIAVAILLLFLRAALGQDGAAAPGEQAGRRRLWFDRFLAYLRRQRAARWTVGAASVAAAMLAGGVWQRAPAPPWQVSRAGAWPFSSAGLLLGLSAMFLWAALSQAQVAARPRRRHETRRARLLAALRVLCGIALCLALTAALGYLSSEVWWHLYSEQHSNTNLTHAIGSGVVACGVLVVAEWWWGRGENRRSLWLLACTYMTLTVLFLLGGELPSAYPVLRRVYEVGALVSAALVWVVALGWTVDPNGVSMHQFYRGRLVRAYLGASNLKRRTQQKEIAESAPDDDIPLAELKNCQRGAPYHLVNATLNLVAGRDLATAQRSACSFVLSARHCGSLRTQYRPTADYMRGRLTLGTAIATSGAAVSPNMGSKKPTAALAMLLTLLNVRLGYWAPTPNRDHWTSAQSGLWPFYLLREFLSQTNDLSSYCYLTDGGHFDNTGLYSLVERGCRFIVLADCGADPQPACFQDLGEAIRRCRIDFGTEIELSLDVFTGAEDKLAAGYVAVGRVIYSPRHAQALGWPGAGRADEHADAEARTGILVYFKPSVTGTETADVRQYALENKHFPQQTTANQWFDEAQFESYRRLGQWCVAQTLGQLPSVERLRRSTYLSPQLIANVFQEARKKYGVRAHHGALRQHA